MNIEWMQRGVKACVVDDVLEYRLGDNLLVMVLRERSPLSAEGYKFDIFGFGGAAGVSHDTAYGKSALDKRVHELLGECIRTYE